MNKRRPVRRGARLPLSCRAQMLLVPTFVVLFTLACILIGKALVAAGG